MKIRAYNENDRDEVISLWNECDLVAPQNDPFKDIERKLKVDPDVFIVGVNELVVSAIGYGYDNVIGLGKRLEYDS